MKVIKTDTELRGTIKQWREAGETIALVPTMGNLHAGHISLIGQAQTLCSRVVTSIFVNPLQFNDTQDLAKYPRTFDQDYKMLVNIGADLLFAPEAEMIYPQGMSTITTVFPGGIADQLEGAFRPGHFTGVTTVVCKLLNLVQPDTAVFGKKDYQQWHIINNMVRDLNLPVSIIAGETVREANGLAMSSRNQRLDQKSRDVAANIYQVMLDCRRLADTYDCWLELEQDGLKKLSKAGLDPDYFAVRSQVTLLAPQHTEKHLVFLVAATVNGVRLIDNLEVVGGNN